MNNVVLHHRFETATQPLKQGKSIRAHIDYSKDKLGLNENDYQITTEYGEVVNKDKVLNENKNYIFYLFSKSPSKA